MTGSTGFLGSYLAEALVERGIEVAALIRDGSDPWRLSAVINSLTVIHGAMADLPKLQNELAKFQPDAVVHMAWHGVGNLDRNSAAQEQNISATAELIACAAKAGAKVFIGAGSQAEYGSYDRAIREDDVPHPTTAYGRAKLAAGSMAGKLAADYGLRFVWLRVFSTYGPKDNDYWLIPSAIKTLRAGKRMALTRCEQRWGFLHARDAAAAFRISLENSSATGVINLGSPDAPPLHETMRTLRDIVDPSGQLGFGDIPYRPDQVMVLQADVGRLMVLGWRPTVDLLTGLRETVAWYDSARQ